jgi:hypothetical protein
MGLSSFDFVCDRGISSAAPEGSIKRGSIKKRFNKLKRLNKKSGNKNRCLAQSALIRVNLRQKDLIRVDSRPVDSYQGTGFSRAVKRLESLGFSP